MTLPWRWIAACCAGVALFAAHAEEKPAAADAAPMALHLLDYVGVDYGGAVEGSRVKSADEYKEMLEFTGEVQALVRTLPEHPQRAALEAEATRLLAQVNEKRDPAAVATSARALRDGIVAAYGIRVTPQQPPDLAHGKALFAQHCAACHGIEGAGDGPLAKTLTPPPTNFHNAERMAGRPLHSFFNTVTLGVKGTAMPAFATLAENDRWDLAAHVASYTGGTASASTPLRHAAERMAASVAAYKAHDTAAASRLAIEAYLEGFELVERTLAQVDADLMTRTERAMMDYRRVVQSGAPAADVEARANEIRELLARARDALDKGGLSPNATFLASYIILLREGLEAVLIVVALLAVLKRGGDRRSIPFVHAGWIVALIAGLATWYAASRLVLVSGADREVTEGVSALVAAAMLLYVGFWLHGKSSADAWHGFLMRGAQGGRSAALGFAFMAFLAVYREIFETVLFYEALWAQAQGQGSAVVGGLAAASLTLALVTFAMLRYSLRLPLGLFFGSSAILMAALSVILAGNGLAALQEAGWVGATPVPFITFSWLGIHPNVECLGLQGLLVFVIVILWRVTRKGESAPRPS